MISMSTIHCIQQMRKQGSSIASIARKTGVSRTTVYKKLEKTDFSEKLPIKQHKSRYLDQFRSTIEAWLDEDAKTWRKQRHTAHRIWVRLTQECGATCAESTVRAYVRELKAKRIHHEQYLDLVWNPGEAQADFGEADFNVYGIKKRMYYFVLSFPYSNVGFAQVFPSENSECVCQALKQIFEYMGAIPTRIIFDNATGIGRKISGSLHTTELFCAFATHYGFSYTFCNPYKGNEKGNVERKVAFIRKNLFVPTPRLYDLCVYNQKLLDKCRSLSKTHYIKAESEASLFEQDIQSMQGLPEKEFHVVRYIMRSTDKQGKIQIEGKHFYSTDPSLARQNVVVALGALTVDIYTEQGEHIVSHKRAYGDVPTDTKNPVSQLLLLAHKSGAWKNSSLREALPKQLKDHLDVLDSSDLRAALRALRQNTEVFGFDTTMQAASAVLKNTQRLDEASIYLAAKSANTEAILYDKPVNLGVYDEAFTEKEASYARY